MVSVTLFAVLGDRLVFAGAYNQKAKNGRIHLLKTTVRPRSVKINFLLIFEAQTICLPIQRFWSGCGMRVLIVESHNELAALWQRHLERHGMQVRRAPGQAAAIADLGIHDTDVLILDLVLQDGSALAVADYASYRQPNARVIFVTNTSFFSDGSIFSLAPNACAFVRTGTPPEDLVAMVEHHGTASAQADDIGVA